MAPFSSLTALKIGCQVLPFELNSRIQYCSPSVSLTFSLFRRDSDSTRRAKLTPLPFLFHSPGSVLQGRQRHVSQALAGNGIPRRSRRRLEVSNPSRQPRPNPFPRQRPSKRLQHHLVTRLRGSSGSRVYCWILEVDCRSRPVDWRRSLEGGS